MTLANEPDVASDLHIAAARRRLDGAALCAYFALGSCFSAIQLYVSESLGGSRALSGFGVSIFFVAAILTRPLVGRWIDVHGRRTILRIGPLALAATFVLLVPAQSVAAVLAVRFLQGVFGSAFYVAAVSASTDLAGENERGSAVARLSLALYAGFAIGPVAGEALLHVGAATAWLVFAACELVAAAIIWPFPETAPPPTVVPDGALDPPQASPLFHRAAVIPGVLLLTLGMGYTSITSQAALYARSIDMPSSMPIYVAFAGSILLVRLFAGKLADRVGALRVLYPGVGCVVAGLTVVAILRLPPTAVLGAALVGTGWALVFPAAVSHISGLVPDIERGAILGSSIAFMDIGQGLGGFAVGSLADSFGFGWAYAVPALLAVVGVGVFRAGTRPPVGDPTSMSVIPPR